MATQTIADASLVVKELYKIALLVREHSYSPYSHFKVGAAIQTSTGQIFGGCNIENASYGASICAERTAIQKAVSELGKIKISQVLVVIDSETLWPPCGLCRQFICEFALPDTQVYLTNLEGIIETKGFEEIFPMGFSPEYLTHRKSQHMAPDDESED